MTEERGGFSLSCSSGVAVGGGRCHSAVIVDLSTSPLYLDEERLLARTEGA